MLAWEGALEFVPAMVYPEEAHSWVMAAESMQMQESPKELSSSENAADALPNHPFISGERNRWPWLVYSSTRTML